MKFQPGFENYFLSPVTGRILESGLPNLERDYIFIGSRSKRTIQSPAIIDIRLELNKIRFRLRDTKFILQSAHDGFSNAQALDELDDGLLKHIKGVIYRALPGTDYYSPGHPTYLVDTYSTEKYNVSVGTENLLNITTGTSNVAMGDYTLSSVTSGSSNTGLGYSALYSVTTGSNNTGIGYQSLYNITSQSDNTALGKNSGFNQNKYTQCSFLGSGSDASVNDLTNSMALGYNASVSTSNTIVLGNSSITKINIPGLNFTFTPNTIGTTNSNGNITFSPNGTGAIQLNNGTNVTPLQFYNADGTFYVGFQAGSLTANTTWTLPISDSSGTQSLVSDGSGHLSWADFMGTALEYKHIWIGNSDNIATPQPMITLDNEPDLTSGNIWRGNSLNRPEESADLSNLENRVTDLETRVTDLEARVTVIEADIVAIQAELAAIQAELIVIAGEIAALQLQVTALEAAVAILQGQVITLFAQIAALDAYVKSITLSTFVIGGPPDPSTGVITTARGPTCLLTNIPAGGDVSFDNYRITNLATFSASTWSEMEDKQLDGINFLFLWQLFGGGTR